MQFHQTNRNIDYSRCHEFDSSLTCNYCGKAAEKCSLNEQCAVLTEQLKQANRNAGDVINDGGADSDVLAMLTRVAERFSGFSLERRSEWKQGPYRVRVIPNKQERQDFRIEVYGKTIREVLSKACQRLDLIDPAP